MVISAIALLVGVGIGVAGTVNSTTHSSIMVLIALGVLAVVVVLGAGIAMAHENAPDSSGDPLHSKEESRPSAHEGADEIDEYAELERRRVESARRSAGINAWSMAISSLAFAMHNRLIAIGAGLELALMSEGNQELLTMGLHRAVEAKGSLLAYARAVFRQSEVLGAVRDPLAPAHLLESAESFARELVTDRGGSVEVTCASDLPRVSANREGVEHALRELVKNAASFYEGDSPPGWFFLRLGYTSRGMRSARCSSLSESRPSHELSNATTSLLRCATRPAGSTWAGSRASGAPLRIGTASAVFSASSA